MKGRISHLFIVGGSLTFLASLYLPWTENVRTLPCPSGATSLLCLFSDQGFQFTGWDSEFGGAAGLVALALMSAAALESTGRAGMFRLPLPSAAFALLFLSVMTGAGLWNSARFQGALNHGTAHREIGMYLGLASAAAVFVAAVGPRALTFTPRFSLVPAVGIALALALLAAVLVPQLTFHLPPRRPAEVAYQLALLGGGLQVAISVLACFSLRLWGRARDARPLLALTAAIAVLTAAHLTPIRSAHSQWPWEFWLLLGCAAGLLALAFVTARGMRLARPALADAATVGAAVVFLVSLFFPWHGQCSRFRCVTPATGWSVTGHAGLFTVLMLLGLLGYRRPFRELSIGAALYVMAAGLVITSYATLAYGAFLGFAGAALLLFFAVRRLRPIRQSRFLVRIVPLAACLGFLSFVVAEISGRGTTFLYQSPWRNSELAAAAIFLVLRLFIRWSDRPRDSDEIVLLPVALLAVTTLDLIVIRNHGISWEGWVSVFLCLLLAVCGWVERYRDGLPVLRIPEEIWRVDRISTGEN